MLKGSEGWLEWSEGWLERFEGQLEGSEGPPAGSEGQPAGSEGQPAESEDGRTDRRMDLLPILQYFIPCWGRSPKSPYESILVLVTSDLALVIPNLLLGGSKMSL